MAQVFPFKGVRYNQNLIKDLSLVITPPYDVISKGAQQQYYDKHPNNIIRLELNRELSEDNSENNKYTRAAKFFNNWLQEKVLNIEDQDALYLYRQEYTTRGEKKIRTGVICRLQTEDYSSGMVLPHEETLPKHKQDRLVLMRNTNANFSPIFGLYADEEKSIDGLLLSTVDIQKPDIVFTDEFTETHLVWVIKDSAVIQEFQRLFKTKKIFIADGHHRYETALNFGKEMLAKGLPGFDKVLINLVNLYDDGLIVLPTHRLLKNLTNFSEATFLEETRKYFNLTPYPSNSKEFTDILEGIKDKSAFGIYFGGKTIFLAVLKKEIDITAITDQTKSLAWRKLDVTALTYLILENILHIDSEKRASGDYITYTRDAYEAFQAVYDKTHQLSLLMNATKVTEVTEVALAGDKMPQKSTYFYPKVISGLVINKLDI